YAVFSSLMTLLPKMIGGYSGSMVDNIGYTNFFLVASLIGVPVLGLIYLIQRHPQFSR
ncbi:MAG: AmpG family muropeptide MFS transporter, partial [Ketobacteraceae bacterium]|nr:AmpG family muropeptide MFS transporter [Ketobacteraceae bacterium]